MPVGASEDGSRPLGKATSQNESDESFGEQGWDPRSMSWARQVGFGYGCSRFHAILGRSCSPASRW
eukprot:15472249-Alexandrium_andersonii.AAC.1